MFNQPEWPQPPEIPAEAIPPSEGCLSEALKENASPAFLQFIVQKQHFEIDLLRQRLKALEDRLRRPPVEILHASTVAKWFAGLMAVLAIGFMVVIAIGAYFEVVVDRNSMTIPKLNEHMLYDVALTACLVFFLNVYSIIIANQSRLKLRGAALSCEYCGKEGSKIVCGGCNSVAYYRLSGFQVFAVFFAHHRWQLNSALIGVFLVVPFGGAYQLIQAKSEEKIQYEKDTQTVLTALNAARGCVLQIANVYPDSIPAAIGERFMNAYFEFSWFAPRIFDYFSQQPESRVTLPNVYLGETSKFLRKKLSTFLPVDENVATSKKRQQEEAERKELARRTLKPKQLAIALAQEKVFPEGGGSNVRLIEYLDNLALGISGTLRVGKVGKLSADTLQLDGGLDLARLFFVGKVAGFCLEIMAFNPTSEQDSDPDAESIAYLSTFLERQYLDTIAGGKIFHLPKR